MKTFINNDLLNKLIHKAIKTQIDQIYNSIRHIKQKIENKTPFMTIPYIPTLSQKNETHSQTIQHQHSTRTNHHNKTFIYEI